MSSQLKRLYASAAVLALGAAGLAPLAAQASEPVHGNIVQKDDASITIHKMEAGSLQGSANADTDNAQGDGVVGVPFKLFRLKLDLTKSDDWKKLQGLNVPEAACSPAGVPDFAQLRSIDRDEATQEKLVETQAGGTATATVSTGAYLVCEQPSPNAKNKAGQSVTVVKKAKAFVATVPTPHPNGQGWLYNIHVYPKNTVVEAPVKTMTVTDQGLQRADAVQIAVETKIPSLADGEHFSHFAVVDPMPVELTNPSGYAGTIESDGTQFTENTDFKVRYSAGGTEKNAVAISFTKTGLEKLRGKKNKTLKVSFTATMNALPANGQANNAAWVFVGKQNTEVAEQEPQAPIVFGDEAGAAPTSSDVNNPPQRTMNTVGMTWGKFTIEKFDKARPETKLENATFKLYVAQNQDSCDGTNLETEGEAIRVGSKEVFTTGSDGRVSIDGVHLHTKSVDGENPDPQKTRCFIIEETVAPAGYVLPQQAKTAVLVDADDTSKLVQISNTQVTGLPDLPLTGASGQLILMVIGSALMLASVGAFMVLRKREAHTA